jgi:hypothetical protein
LAAALGRLPYRWHKTRFKLQQGQRHSNIQRYRNLLQTSLTELERKFVEQRLTEEQSNLESLTNSPSQ